MAFARRRFRPHFWPTAVTLVALAILLGLGTWQVQRLHWKEGLIADMTSRMAAPPIPLPRDLSDPALEYRPVRLTGRFLNGKELYVAARTHNGQPGLHVVTPMRLDDGRTVLVDRGWVPPERQFSVTRSKGEIDGTVTVDGVIRRGGWHGMEMFRPANDPAHNQWLWFDLPEMAAYDGLVNVVSRVYVAAGPAKVPGGYPIGEPTRVNLVNHHLQYAITWYALAVALLVIYVLHQSRPVAEESPDERV
jgi:surfeit locus 1 family protein